MSITAPLVHVGEAVRAGGGPFGYLHNLAEGLRARGETGIDVVGLSDESTAGTRRSPIADFARRLLPEEILRPVRGVRSLRRTLHSDAHLVRQAASALSRIRAARAVVFHDPFLAGQYLMAGPAPRQSVWIMPHAPVDVAAERAASFRARYGRCLPWSYLGRLWRRRELAAYVAAAGILAPSRGAVDGYFRDDRRSRAQFERVRLLEIMSGAPRLPVHAPARATRAAWGFDDETLVFGFFGRYQEHKGFDIFAAAAQALADHGARAGFVAVGDGPLKRRAGAHVRDLGRVAHANVGTLMHAVDAVVVPNRQTYFDLVILEAFALGKAVITTAVGGSRSLPAYTEGVALLAEASVSSLCAALASVDGATLARMGEQNARAYDEHFTIAAFVDRHVELARRLVEPDGRPDVNPTAERGRS